MVGRDAAAPPVTMSKRIVELIDRALHVFFRRRIEVTQIKRILLLRQDRIGDLVLTMPALGALREHFPDATIDVIVSTEKRKLVEGNPFVNRVIEQKMNWFNYLVDGRLALRAVTGMRTLFSKAFWELVGELRAGRYDVAIDFVGKRRNVLLTLLARIPYRVGNHVWGGSFLLTNRIPLKYGMHYAQLMLCCLAPLGISEDVPRLKLYLPRDIDEVTLNRYRSLRREGKPLVGVSLNETPLERKKWQEGHWKKLLALLLGDDRFQVVLFCSPLQEEKAWVIGGEFVSTGGLHIEIPRDLGTLMHLINNLDLLVSVDSGPVHIAAGLDVPTVVLFGSDDPRIWGPLQRRTRILRRAPELSPFEALFDDARWINGIRPQEVYDAAVDLLGEVGLVGGRL